ncbi:MAG: RlmE family RNA methyltransferase [Candidatus Verstraetearchaeota archaeon]|nr:RlmE family RNA methyltransferase [Candidatus Verstraetearchaeota archaeon]
MPDRSSILGDYYYREAKRHGYRSRSALKLLEISDKFRIFRRGDVVVDLGSAPGGWLQVARQLAGDDGLVIGVDLAEIDPLPHENVILLRGDAGSPQLQDELVKLTGAAADVVTSDMAPKFTGIHDLDHGRQIALANVALEVAKMVLRPGGKMVLKVLMGADFEAFRKDVQRLFANVRVYKPNASRDSSSEVYFVCTRFSGPSGD